MNPTYVFCSEEGGRNTWSLSMLPASMPIASLEWHLPHMPPGEMIKRHGSLTELGRRRREERRQGSRLPFLRALPLSHLCLNIIIIHEETVAKLLQAQEQNEPVSCALLNV